MFLVQRINQRPNTSVSFYTPTEEYIEHFQINYRESGRVLFDSRTLSEDLLTLTIDTVWRDAAALDEYLADPAVIAMQGLRDAYLAEHGITVERKANPI